MVNNGMRREIRRSSGGDGITGTKTTEGASIAVDLEGLSSIAMRSPNSSVSSVDVYGSESEDGTFTVVEDSDGAPITISLNGNAWRPVSTDLFPMQHVKFVTDVVGNIEWVGKG